MFSSECPEKYDVVISLGQACPTAFILSALKLRNEAYPFDWLWNGGGIQSRVDFIMNDFKNFLVQDKMLWKGDRQFPQPCHIYQNKETGMIFNHDFPLNMTFEENFPLVCKKYERRIKRLYDRIKKSKKILFVYLDRPEYEMPVSDKELVLLHTKLAEKFSIIIDILYFHLKHGISEKEAEIFQISPNIRKISFDFEDHSPEAVEPKTLGGLLLPFFDGCSIKIPLGTKIYKFLNLNKFKGNLLRRVQLKIYYKLYRHFQKILRAYSIIEK